MKWTVAKRIGFVILLPILIFWVWYSIAADYGYTVVYGTYSLDNGSEKSTLVLSSNRRFQEEVIRGEKSERAEGSWRRIGQGGIVFSKEFLKLAGQELRPTGEADAEVHKRYFGLLPWIQFDPDPEGPSYHKRLFR